MKFILIEQWACPFAALAHVIAASGQAFATRNQPHHPFRAQTNGSVLHAGLLVWIRLLQNYLVTIVKHNSSNKIRSE
jgi:hypothetical protein